MAKIRAASNYRLEPLAANWELAEGTVAITAPTELESAQLAWQPALCPGTVASALRARKAWDWSSTRNFDGSDWWYRVRFASTPCTSGESLWLELDGLATIAEVWLNGSHVLRSENMFCGHELDVSSLVATDNELLIRFCSLDVASSARRPRPRFKTRLVERQQLRWFRTTLLGRIPAWSPPVTAVGPWRGARLVRRRSFSIVRADVRPVVDHERALVTARLTLNLHDVRLASAMLQVGSSATPFIVQERDGVTVLEAELTVADARRWWPHSHGEQPRYPARVTLETSAGSEQIDLDALAFRSVVAETSGDRFALIVNDTEIRCRGACWTPSDVVSLGDDAETLNALRQAHAAGMNMVRVGGTMIYESDAFYEECDRRGILVWQDFMFANCDYPGEDDVFRESVTREAEQFLRRTETRACLAVLCGNSEVEQQVAMLGLSREMWHPPLFESVLRAVAQAQRGDVPYVASTPTGGTLPFQPNAGLTHYYGVGAYLRPLEDARRADLKFTPECLGFANIPEDRTIEEVLGDGRSPFHDPSWKARVPRDSGPGWDFDDVRDHYTKLLFGVDPAALRYEDTERALALGRVTSGEVMARSFAEWRRGSSSCRGALIWFLRDLWPGAGWGLIDARGVPKAAYYFVKRAMQPRALFFVDEGLNGLSISIVNDSARALVTRLELQLLRAGSIRVANAERVLEIPARGTLEVESSSLFERFMDLTRAYRFGPSQYDVAIGALRDPQSGALISEAFYFPNGLPSERTNDLGLEARAELAADGSWQLSLKTKRFAHAVAVDVPGFVADDGYFNLAPDRERMLRLTPDVPGTTPRGSVRALNAQNPTRIVTST